jgi:hypothetical protein
MQRDGYAFRFELSIRAIIGTLVFPLTLFRYHLAYLVDEEPPGLGYLNTKVKQDCA